MPLKFSANVETMFPEIPRLPDRYQAAKEAGFKAVETWDLDSYSLDDLVAARTRANIEQTMLVTGRGDVSKGEFGFAALPSREDTFLSSLENGIRYAKALKCSMVHVTAGNTVGVPYEEAAQCYRRNMKIAVQRMEKENLTVLIEPISKVLRPHYHMTDVNLAVELIKEINSPNLKLELDIFHLQLMCGNLTNIIKEFFELIGNVQIAQAPNRQEPNSSGEVNYKYILNLLDHLGYDGWIGCEYIPAGNTERGLSWLEEFGYRL